MRKLSYIMCYKHVKSVNAWYCRRSRIFIAIILPYYLHFEHKYIYTYIYALPVEMKLWKYMLVCALSRQCYNKKRFIQFTSRRRSHAAVLAEMATRPVDVITFHFWNFLHVQFVAFVVYICFVLFCCVGRFNRNRVAVRTWEMICTGRKSGKYVY